MHAYNAGISRLWSYARHRSEHVTLVICRTLVGRRDSGRMPHSGRKTQLRSDAQLWSEDVTPVIL
jgi:hypothetical protein